MKINDFTPEYDYLSGGAKMIICCEIDGALGIDDKIEINFDDLTVSATMIQRGVLKCYVPASEDAKRVNLEIVVNGETCSFRSFESFEYKKKKKQSKFKAGLVALEGDDHLVDRAFKVRLIDRLNFMNEVEGGNPGSSIQMGGGSGHIYSKSMTPMDVIKRAEAFNDAECASTLTQIIEWIRSNCGEDKAKELLNECDTHGFYIVHYLSKLNFLESLKVALKYGADVNVKYNNNITPLHIAFSAKNKELIGVLMASKMITNFKIGEQITISDSQSELNATENSSTNKVLSMQALVDNKDLLESLLREVTLGESLVNIRGNNSFTDSSIVSGEPSIDGPNENKDSLDISYNTLINLFESENNDSITSRDPENPAHQEKNSRGQLKVQEKEIEERKRRRLNRMRRKVEGGDSNFEAKQNLGSPGHEDGIKLEGYQLVGNKDDQENYSEVTGQVEIIQKNVKCWLRRRQYLDVKYAVGVLQNCNFLFF